MLQIPAARPRLLPLILALAALVALFHLALAWRGTPIYRAMYLGTALEYARGSIDLLHPVVVGFNATGTPTAQEFPLWQALTAALFKLTGSYWYGLGNAVSLALFFSALWPFYRLAATYSGDRPAAWATVFFLVQPLNVLISGMAGPDSLALALTLWFLYFADRMARDNPWFAVAAAFAGALLAVTKAPFFFAAGLTSAGLLLVSGQWTLRPWLRLLAVGAVAIALFGLWTRHANQLAAQAEFPYAEMRFSHSPFLQYWYFGDLAYRLDPAHWIRGGWRFLHATLGVLPLVGLLIPALVRGGNGAAKLWLGAGLLTTLVFTHVVLEHWHYYLPFAPAVAILCGATLARWEDFWTAELPLTWFRLPLAGLVLALTTVNGLITMRLPIQLDPYPRDISAQIRDHTAPTDKLILFTIDQNWGGEELFASGRQGLTVISLRGGPRAPSPKGLLDILENPADLARLKTLGYNTLVLVSESPVRHAIQNTKPGRTRPRIQYPDTLTPEADHWPVLHQSPDLSIRRIP